MKRQRKITILIMTLLVIAMIPIIIQTNKKTETTQTTINIPVTELSTNAKFFEEEIDGVNVQFFSVKDEQGNIKTAMNACDVCYNSKKGYTQDGDYMICNNCGNRYHISGLGTENKRGGGCWPSYLESEVIEDELVIQTQNLAKAKYQFR